MNFILGLMIGSFLSSDDSVNNKDKESFGFVDILLLPFRFLMCPWMLDTENVGVVRAIIRRSMKILTVVWTPHLIFIASRMISSGFPVKESSDAMAFFTIILISFFKVTYLIAMITSLLIAYVLFFVFLRIVFFKINNHSRD